MNSGHSLIASMEIREHCQQMVIKYNLNITVDALSEAYKKINDHANEIEIDNENGCRHDSCLRAIFI